MGASIRWGGIYMGERGPREYDPYERDGVCTHRDVTDPDLIELRRCDQPATSQVKPRLGRFLAPLCERHRKVALAVDTQIECKNALLAAARGWAVGTVPLEKLRELADDDVRAREIRRRLDRGWSGEEW